MCCVEMLVPHLAVRGIAIRLAGTGTAALYFSLCGLLIVARYSPAEGYKETPTSVGQGTSAEFFWRRAGEPLEGRAPKLSTNVEEILSRVNGSFVEQNSVMQPSTVPINHSVITVTACYNNTISSQ